MWDGRFQRVEPNEECYNAAREVLAERRNTNALFLRIQGQQNHHG